MIEIYKKIRVHPRKGMPILDVRGFFLAQSNSSLVGKQYKYLVFDEVIATCKGAHHQKSRIVSLVKVVCQVIRKILVIQCQTGLLFFLTNFVVKIIHKLNSMLGSLFHNSTYLS